MKAVMFRNGKAMIEECSDPDPSNGEILVKMLVAGICNTDVEISKGYMSFSGIPGHEFVGETQTAGNKIEKGTRVIGEINAGCGQCPKCLTGMERHCSKRTVLGIYERDGAFAEYLLLPEKNLLRVPDTISDEDAVFTEPLAAALEILEQVKVEPDHNVLVIGGGKLGLLICMVLRLTGCNLSLLTKHPRNTQTIGNLGINIVSPELVEQTGQHFNIVVEASGHPSGWLSAVELVEPRGTIVLKSTYHEPLNFNPAVLVVNEITVIGSRCGRFGPALRLMERQLVNPSDLISAKFPLEEAALAFEEARRPGVLKVLLTNHN